jgi:MATE family multidrug resistance protein
VSASPSSASPDPAAQSQPRRHVPLSHLQVLAIAAPIMLSNATTPLVGYADTVVIGRLGSETLMGAVAISANVFNYIYWIFGFLRMGTTGFTAQAVGADDPDEIAASLGRAGAIALGMGVVFILIQGVLGPFAFWLMGSSEGVTRNALIYFEIRIWGAPAALMNFALVGWFIGLSRADIAFVLQLILNLVNIGLAVLFVQVFDLGVAGVGYAVLVAEIVAVTAGLLIARRELKRRGGGLDLARLRDAKRLAKFFGVNRDIMMRTLCLLFAFAFFTSQSARTDDTTLAVNALLFSIAMICTYLLDGFAFAAETLVGKSIGARDPAMFNDAVRLSTIWAGIVAIVLATGVLFGGPWMIDFAATNTDVREAARVFLIWAALLPLVGVWCFQLDGIFIGATQSVDMRNMMLISLAVYLAAAFPLMTVFGNHGLWLALYVFFLIRALTLLLRMPKLRRDAFGSPAHREGSR